MELSICLTVYNQISMLKERLDYLVQYKGNDIEIVISDDCSTDDIKSLIKSYNDERIKYYKTPQNYGHDLNILYGLSCCANPYVMLFRVRDSVNISSINEILNLINKYPDAGFYYTSAIDPNGKKRLKFNDKVYKCGFQSAKAHFQLPLHPSGVIYNKNKLNLSLYKYYMENFFNNIYGFIVHHLIRCDLSQNSDFVTSQIEGWIYAYTLTAQDVAVNSSRDKKNVYAPEYCYPRYRCEFMFIKNEVKKEYRKYYLSKLLHYYFYSIGYRSRVICQDLRYAKHYGAQVEKINISDVCHELSKITQEMSMDLPWKDRKCLNRNAKIQIIKIKTIYRFKAIMRNIYFMLRKYLWKT